MFLIDDAMYSDEINEPDALMDIEEMMKDLSETELEELSPVMKEKQIYFLVKVLRFFLIIFLRNNKKNKVQLKKSSLIYSKKN